LALAAKEHMPVLFIERQGNGWRSQSTPEFERYRKM
jgi:thiamine biosynthesis lipoprotein ApbE